jgi:hypothetical protein
MIEEEGNGKAHEFTLCLNWLQFLPERILKLFVDIGFVDTHTQSVLYIRSCKKGFGVWILGFGFWGLGCGA